MTWIPYQTAPLPAPVDRLCNAAAALAIEYRRVLEQNCKDPARSEALAKLEDALTACGDVKC